MRKSVQGNLKVIRIRYLFQCKPEVFHAIKMTVIADNSQFSTTVKAGSLESCVVGFLDPVPLFHNSEATIVLGLICQGYLVPHNQTGARHGQVLINEALRAGVFQGEGQLNFHLFLIMVMKD